MFCVFHAVLSVHCSLVATCWEGAGLLALLFAMFSCVIVTFPCVVLGQVWYLIVSIPDFYLLNYIYHEWASIKNCLFMLSTKRRYSNQHTCYVQYNNISIGINNHKSLASCQKKQAGPPGFTCWISFAPVFSLIYC